VHENPRSTKADENHFPALNLRLICTMSSNAPFGAIGPQALLARSAESGKALRTLVLATGRGRADGCQAW
jgi:hypothetical protein